MPDQRLVDVSSSAAPAADVIEARLDRLELLGGGGNWNCPGAVSQFASLAAAGFVPAGEVFGTTVVRLGTVDTRPRCTGSWTFTPRSDLASAGGPLSALLRRLNGARRRALERAVAECVAMGADGIVGAQLSVTSAGAGALEFTVTGTAVRARSAVRPGAPFTAHVSGQELARLLDAGWMPLSVVFGVAIASRHEGQDTRRQTRRRSGAAGNKEVRSYSLLVTDARRDARNQMDQAVRELGGEGVVVNEMTLSISERECPTNEGEHDRVAQAAIHGTALVSFARTGREAPRSPLAIMRLNPPARAGTGTGIGIGAGNPVGPDAGEPAQEEHDIPEAGLPDRLIARREAWRRKHDSYTNDYQNNRNGSE
jgi:uncharacterized protein YbjQ (UPF0145 family)